MLVSIIIIKLII